MQNNKKLINKYRFNYSIVLWKDAFVKNANGYFVKMFWKNKKEIIKLEFLIKDSYLTEFDDRRNIMTVPYNFKTKYINEKVNLINDVAQWTNNNTFEDITFSEIFKLIAEYNTKYPHEIKTQAEGK